MRSRSLDSSGDETGQTPTLRVSGDWESVFEGGGWKSLEKLLPDYLRARRWFGGKARSIETATFLEDIRLPYDDRTGHVLLVEVKYTEGTPETYVMPLTFATGDRADFVRSQYPESVLLELEPDGAGEDGVLYDALWDEGFGRALLDVIVEGRRISGKNGQLTATSTRALKPLIGTALAKLKPSVASTEQSNTSVRYGEKLILKTIRKQDPGINPELEIGRFLTEGACMPSIAPVAGALEYRQPGRESITVAVLSGFVTNQGDAWQYTLNVLDRYFREAVARPLETQELPTVSRHLLDTLEEEPPPIVRELLGFYLEQTGLLGQRTAELHLALASDRKHSDFAPEPWTDLHQRSLYLSMCGLGTRVLGLLKNRLKDMPGEVQLDGQRVLALEAEVLDRFQALQDRRLDSMRIRTHGDYHLGQVLYTGMDFVIIDFEGEPARPLSERRRKASGLRDVAGMLRSFDYAAMSAALTLVRSPRPLGLNGMEGWRRLFSRWASAAFLKRYLAACHGATFVPSDRAELRLLLDAHLLDKAIYELGYELNNRPAWVGIPLRGILEVMDMPSYSNCSAW